MINMAVNWGDFKTRPSAVWYVQLADFVEAAIRDGRLRQGDRLPSQRELGELTGTSTELATKATAVLRDRGLVETSVRGSFVKLIPSRDQQDNRGPKGTEDQGQEEATPPRSRTRDRQVPPSPGKETGASALKVT